jgi:hypothetical protein
MPGAPWDGVVKVVVALAELVALPAVFAADEPPPVTRGRMVLRNNTIARMNTATTAR